MTKQGYWQFEEGVRLLRDAMGTEDRPAIEARVLQDFWTLEESEKEKALTLVRAYLQPGSGHATPRFLAMRTFLLNLLFDAVDGDAVWREVCKTGARAVDYDQVSGFIERRPDKFAPGCLADIHEFLQRTLEKQAKVSPLLGGALARYQSNMTVSMRKLLALAYKSGLTTYLERSGPLLGASFETEISELAEESSKAGVGHAVIDAFRRSEDYLARPEDEFSFTSSMDFTRKAYEKIIENRAQACGVKPAKTGGATLKLLFDHEKLTKHEYNLGHWLYKFISERGSHALDSERTEAKVVLFMAIEYSLYLIARLTPSEQGSA